MKFDLTERTVLVPLPAHFVDALIKMHATLSADLVGALEASIEDTPRSLSEGRPVKTSQAPPLPDRKYAAEFLGTPFTTWTLPEVFAGIVDMTAMVAPEALNKLAEMSARRRRFVARNPEAIHPGNRDLPVMQTASGWWISKNIGQEDLKRALRALSDATGLKFGSDVKFSLQRPLKGIFDRFLGIPVAVGGATRILCATDE